MHFIGKISDQSYVQHSGIYKTGEPNRSQVKASIAREHGGSPNDYDVYFINNDSDLAASISMGASFSLVWEDGYITDIDTTEEDSKKYIDITTDKSSVTNNSESATITFTMYQSDGVTVDTTFRGAVRLLCSGPVDVFEAEAYLNVGEGSLQFSPDIAGSYEFPSGKVYCGSLDDPRKYKTKNRILIESIVR